MLASNESQVMRPANSNNQTKPMCMMHIYSWHVLNCYIRYSICCCADNIHSQAHSLESLLLSCLHQELLFTSDRALEMPSRRSAAEIPKESAKRSNKRRKQQMSMKSKRKTIKHA